MADLERELAMDAGVEALMARCHTKTSNGKRKLVFNSHEARTIVAAILVNSSAAIAKHRAYLAAKDEE